MATKKPTQTDKKAPVEEKRHQLKDKKKPKSTPKTKPTTTQKKLGKFEKVRGVIVQAIAGGASYRMACNVAGIVDSTFYTWMATGRDNPDSDFATFRSEVLQAESQQGQKMLALIQQHAVKDWKAAAWVLERRHGFTRDGRVNTDQVKNVDIPKDTYDLLKQQAADLYSAVQQAEQSESWQAYAALQRQLLTVVQQIRAIDSENAMNTEIGLTDEQMITEITNTILTLPPILRQRLEAFIVDMIPKRA